VYEFGFHVRGTNQDSANPIAFALKANGLLITAGTRFKSPNLGNVVGVAEGHGLVPLLAGDVVTLGNITGGGLNGSETVSVGPSTTDATVGASLFLILVRPGP